MDKILKVNGGLLNGGSQFRKGIQGCEKGLEGLLSGFNIEIL